MTRFALLRPVLEAELSQSALARQEQLPLRTVQRWVRQYRRFGLVGLARKARTDRGARRGLPAELIQLVEGLALQKPRRSVAALHRRLLRVAVEQGWPQPSYGRVYAIVRQLDPACLTLAHKGAKAYREEFDLLYRRAADHANAMWQADHSPLPIWLVDEHDQPARPWLTVILDDYSRAVAGYFLGFQNPTALQTALTLHQAIWRKEDPRWHVCGIPSTFYTDHGSDFTSRHLEQVAADLKITLINSLPGAPRGRGKVERFFRTVEQLLLPDLPGFAPEGRTGVVPRLSLAAFDTRFRAWLLDDYLQRVHSELGVAPQARWEAEGFLPRMPESLEQLDLLLLTVANARRVHPDGIHFQGRRYLDPTLAAYVGEAVTIRYDPRDMAELRVFYRETFLCRAICPELAGQKISLKEITQARNARRKQVRQGIDRRLAVVDQWLAVHRPDAPPEPVLPLSADPDGPHSPPPAPMRLKRYLHE
jgi:putative transposase